MASFLSETGVAELLNVRLFFERSEIGLKTWVVIGGMRAWSLTDLPSVACCKTYCRRDE